MHNTSRFLKDCVCPIHHEKREIATLLQGLGEENPRVSPVFAPIRAVFGKPSRNNRRLSQFLSELSMPAMKVV